MSYDVKVEPIKGHGLINIRADVAAQKAIGESLGYELPIAPHSALQVEDVSVLCFAEDQWWVRCSLENEMALFNQLYDLQKNHHCATTLLSDHFTGFSIIGPDVSKVLRQGMTIDLNTYATGQCTRAGFARCGASIQVVKQNFHYDLFVESSYSSYVAQWFKAATSGVRNSLTR
ncbi:MAG: heterotetrameric sarcosine oxidase gamma subunit [Parasphingorhabdus sp.]|jgi:heterotetrameric sarcosine oxidase gamma subunit